MRIGDVTFSKKGFEDFEKLTKAEQKKFLKKRMPLKLQFDSLLKEVKYAKRKKNTRKAKENKQSESTSKRSGEDSN